MIKVFVIFFLMLTLVKNSYALVVAPLFAIPVIKITVAIVGMLSIPAAKLVSTLKTKSGKQKISIFLGAIVLLSITTYVFLQAYQQTLTVNTNTSHISLSNLLVKFALSFAVLSIPISTLEYLEYKRFVVFDIFFKAASVAAIATVLITLVQTLIFN